MKYVAPFAEAVDFETVSVILSSTGGEETTTLPACPNGGDWDE